MSDAARRSCQTFSHGLEVPEKRVIGKLPKPAGHEAAQVTAIPLFMHFEVDPSAVRV
jgi:hypothetical protein